ncbi:hypothetical protein CAC42_5062 [Sphaceloma murrayae]|uniref:Protein phosphatase n=1 Tax=Sphaceloma murrayae TaxID=2082308 RepID=A0A2K1QUH2_9PEZI|nr:hypothetical protein CAC42_5062 [Sphaceloma murrayae]
MLRTWLVRPQHALVSIPARRTPATITNRDNRGRRSYSDAKIPPFTYHVGASASGKRSKLRQAEHGVNFWTQKDVEERDPSIFTSIEKFSGQDAFFMAHIAKSKMHVVFSVADGVGGWEDQGVNPAAFSHGLCRYMAEATLRPEQQEDLRPIHLMQKAYDQVQKDKKIPAGGSTASVATVDATGYMEVANLGDSGFVILSPGKVNFKSEAQTSNFNTPFQMSKLTAQMKAQQAIFGGAITIQDTPSRSDITHHELEHGDVVVFGTDGLWDNLSAMEVLQIISVQMEKAGHWIAGSRSVDDDGLSSLLFPSRNPAEDLAGQMAYAVMKEAKVASLDARRDGPFAKEVHRWFPGEDYHGGKVDDIAVVVCVAIQHAQGSIKAKL